MQLTVAQQQLVVRQIQAFWPGNRKCPICDKNADWEISGIMELREYNEGNFVVGGGVTPVVVMVCSVCGGTQLFNAIKTKIVDSKTGRLLTQ